jgi:hypothetical protein
MSKGTGAGGFGAENWEGCDVQVGPVDVRGGGKDVAKGFHRLRGCWTTVEEIIGDSVVVCLDRCFEPGLRIIVGWSANGQWSR